MNMDYIVRLALLFFFYSFLGWCIEVVLKYRQYHRFINRGFLTGPWLPIYGSGAVLITVFVGLVSKVETSYGTTFVLSFLICGVVEYLASYILEKRYHARWWDYSQKPMNLNGRVWIGNLILFGLGGVLIIHVANPVLYRLFDAMGAKARDIIACVLGVVFIADLIVSTLVMKMVKAGVENSEADNTEEVNAEIKHLLSDKSYFHRRFAEAYPDVIYRTEKINARRERIKAETERLKAEAQQRIDGMGKQMVSYKEQISSAFESSGAIKDSLIAKQDRMITLLYDETKATEEEKVLRGEIQNDLDRLGKRRRIGPKKAK